MAVLPLSILIVLAPGSTDVASADDSHNPALVSMESISNGCGGGPASGERRFGDTSSYRAYNRTEQRYQTFVVNFRKACNLHDAGYSGAVVRDDLNSGTVTDFRTWTQEEVDKKFFTDMQKLCEQQIPDWADDALRNCKGHGDPISEGPSFGAESRYDFVRSNGYEYFRKRANLNGRWTRFGGPGLVASIKQDGRSISASWLDRVTGNCGEFEGLLVSRDQDEIVNGVTTINGKSAKYDGYFTIQPGNRYDFVLYWHGPPGAAQLVRARRTSNGVGSACLAPTPAKTTTTTTTQAGSFVLTSTKVANPNAPELTIDATGGKAVWDHTGANGGAGKGG
jgi:hypothetical protein